MLSTMLIPESGVQFIPPRHNLKIFSLQNCKIANISKNFMNVIINKLCRLRSIMYLCFIKQRNELCVVNTIFVILL